MIDNRTNCFGAKPARKDNVCVDSMQILDSCRDKDCVEDLRFYPTAAAQEVLSASQMIKGGTAELLYVYTDVEPVTFNRGFYSVDMRFYYRVTLQVCTGTPRYTEAEGLCVFDKRCILFGSEGNAKIFSSDTVFDELDVPGRVRTNLPVAVVEAVDPIVLDTRVAEVPPVTAERSCLAEIPSFVAQSFSGDLVFDDSAARRLYVTLGQFTLVRLERDTQLLVPVYDYCVPQCQCECGSQEDPCGLFRSVAFPMNEFFPPNSVETPCDYNSTKSYCACHGAQTGRRRCRLPVLGGQENGARADRVVRPHDAGQELCEMGRRGRRPLRVRGRWQHLFFEGFCFTNGRKSRIMPKKGGGRCGYRVYSGQAGDQIPHPVYRREADGAGGRRRLAGYDHVRRWHRLL